MRSFGFSLDLFLEVSPQNSFNANGWVRDGGVSVRYLLVLFHRAGMWEGGKEGWRPQLMLHGRGFFRT